MVGGEKRKAAGVSIASNGLLTAAKFTAAILSGSVSVLSEAIHSLGDMAASALAYFSVRMSDKPADEDHPFGHGKVESLAGLAEALLLLGAAGYVGYEAIRRFSSPARINAEIALVVVAATAGVNIFVSRYLKRVAEETDSEALRADAAHITADVVTSVGVLLALLLVKITGKPYWDPIVALALSVWIVWTALKIMAAALSLLMDISLPENEIQIINDIFKTHPEVLGWHQLRTRKAGSHRHIDGHIMLRDDLTLVQAHSITEDIEDRVRNALTNVSISLHMEPYGWEEEHRKLFHKDENQQTK